MEAFGHQMMASSNKSIDSWDIENFNYIRKISESSLTVHCPAKSKIQDSEQYLKSSIDVLIENRCSRSRISSVSSTNECSEDFIKGKDYMLDVLTVKNESLPLEFLQSNSAKDIANTSDSFPICKSDTLQTPSSLSDYGTIKSTCSESHQENKEILNLTTIEVYGIDECDSVSETSSSGLGTSSHDGEYGNLEIFPIKNQYYCCPNCGINGKASPLLIFPFSTIEKEPDGIRNCVGEIWDLNNTKKTVSQNASNYLFSSIANGRSNQRRSNFRIDQKGQLLIDYSPNWKGLEEYIEKITLTKLDH